MSLNVGQPRLILHNIHDLTESDVQRTLKDLNLLAHIERILFKTKNQSDVLDCAMLFFTSTTVAIDSLKNLEKYFVDNKKLKVSYR